MNARITISDDYRRLQRDLHDTRLNYGVTSLGFVAEVKGLMDRYGLRSLSDYGAGKCNLKKGLDEIGADGFDYYPFDPAYPEYGEARPGDLLTCIDVLEHIEEPYLDAVLQDLADLTHRFGFFTIHVGPAKKALADGRNAHLIQQPSSWWLPRLCQHFEILQLAQTAGGFSVLVEPRRTAA